MTVSECIMEAVDTLKRYDLWPDDSLLVRHHECETDHYFLDVEWCSGGTWYKHRVPYRNMEDDIQCLKVKIALTVT